MFGFYVLVALLLVVYLFDLFCLFWCLEFAVCLLLGFVLLDLIGWCLLYCLILIVDFGFDFGCYCVVWWICFLFCVGLGLFAWLVADMALITVVCCFVIGCCLLGLACLVLGLIFEFGFVWYACCLRLYLVGFVCTD